MSVAERPERRAPRRDEHAAIGRRLALAARLLASLKLEPLRLTEEQNAETTRRACRNALRVVDLLIEEAEK